MVISNALDWLKRSNRLSDKRIERAELVLGRDVVDRLLVFSLHLWGGEARSIADAVGWPTDTVNGVIKRVNRVGLPAGRGDIITGGGADRR